MSDFPSINNLLNKSGKKSGSNNITVSAPDDTAEEKFDKKILAMDLKNKEELAVKQAASLGVPYIDLSKFPVAAEALKIIPPKQATEDRVVCFFNMPGELRLGCVDLTDRVQEVAYQLGERHHATTRVYLISQYSFDKVVKLYTTLPSVKPVTKDINITDEELEKFKSGVVDFRGLERQFLDVSISDILTLMIAAALKMESSDVHIEAEENGIMVRYRIDGILHDVATLPKEQWKKFVSRIKLLATLKINVDDRPQDGRVTIRLSSGSLDVRVSTMPTIYGESVVMRILHSGNKGVTFDELGLRGDAYVKLKKEVERPNGMIITTGPTGSGKTTTMYAILNTLNKPGVKIITLEDPVEIKIDGINQSQVDVSREYTFAKGLRSLLRQDPDICLVGEIRDLETAEIAIQAALTGHLMLSTIHTNSASGTIPRFLSMGVKPFLLAPSLNSVIGQRLVRKICEYCQVEDELSSEQKEKVLQNLETLPQKEKDLVDFKKLIFYKGEGCKECSGLGYKGRIGIYEIFIMNKELEQIILGPQISEYVVQDWATKNGMVTMVQDGLLKALDKITTVEEVFRVIE